MFKNSKYKNSIVFLALILGICFFYNYPQIYNYSPRSAHNWRQTTCTSQAFNYYQNGMHLTKPQMHYALAGEGYAVGECPILFYGAAVLYKVFGFHEGIYRTFFLFIFLIGLFSFYKMLYESSNDFLYALVGASLIFTSPVVAFYGFNFIINAPALGIQLFACFCAYRLYTSQKKRWLLFATLAFLLAGWLKVTALISFVALMALFFLELTGITSFRKNGKAFQQRGKIILSFITVIIGVAAWMYWADWYNEATKNAYFLASIKPIWAEEMGTIKYIFNRILSEWSWAYFHQKTILLFGFLLVFILATPRQHPRFLYLFNWLVFLGVSAQFILWFKQYEHHDYYAVDMMILPATIIFTLGVWLNRNHNDAPNSIIFKIALIGVLVFNLLHARKQINYRYQADSVYMNGFNTTFYKKESLQAFLKSKGIQYPDKVISIPDPTPNATLYHMNLMGWTELFVNNGMHAAKVDQFIEKGAKYLIVNDKKYLEKDDLKPYFSYPLGNFKERIFVYDLRGFSKK